MLEITRDHVTKLTDEDLRTLVTRLCEAELRARELPLSSITSGGDQNAADGGIDVRVEITELVTSALDFIPRPTTGFQVKRADMPASKIGAEMRPKGRLRESILDLIRRNGAYVIVSSQGSVADSPLLERRLAMQAAIADATDTASIHLDFYDQERIANWVRSYPGVGLWLRQRIGEAISGWQGYRSWAFGDLDNSEFLLDGQGRLTVSGSPNGSLIWSR